MNTHHEHSPNESVNVAEDANTNVNRFSIHVDSTALSIIALVLSTAAIVIVISQAVTNPQIVDAKITASIAQAQSSMSDKIADAQATAQAGKEHARIALDEVQRSNAQLEAKGLLKHATH